MKYHKTINHPFPNSACCFYKVNFKEKSHQKGPVWSLIFYDLSHKENQGSLGLLVYMNNF